MVINIGGGVAKAGKGCMNSIAGIFFGVFLFGLAFLPAWCSENVEEVSKLVDKLPMTSLADASSTDGLIKIQGEPVDVDYIDFTQRGCPDLRNGLDVFWYEWTLYEYTEHEVTSTDSDGDTITRIEEDWEVQETESDVADFSIEDIEVHPGSARVLLVDADSCDDRGSEIIGEEWLHVEYMPVDDLDTLLVIGEKSGDRIRDGHPFIVTDLNSLELVAQLAQEEATERKVWTFISILLFFIAFNLIIGPLLFVLKYVPVIGKGLRFMIGVGSLILAVIFTFLTKFIIAFWWVIVLLLIVIIVILINKSKKKEAPAPAASPVPAPAPAPAPEVHKAEEDTDGSKPEFCPKCGDPVDVNEKYCTKCGHNLFD